ncbi:MAG: hypothetical protein OHK005_11220 [Candidatus Methylacidiphilales bacterium]
MLQQRLARDKIYSQASYWNEKAELYLGDSVSMWRNPHVNQSYHAEQLNFLLDSLGNPTGLRILDAGCGTGRMARELAARGAKVVGVDFSDKTIDLARKLSPDGLIEYREGTVFDLPVDGPFDAIVCTGVLSVACHSEDDVCRVLRVFHGAMSPGGRLIVMEPFHTGPLRRVLKMSARDFIRILEANGFTLLGKKPLQFWPTRLLLAYVKWGRGFSQFFLKVGQWMLRRRIFQGFGDYSGICAERK